MRDHTLAAVLVATTLLAGCARPQPRAVQYFATHLAEANSVSAACRTGATRGDACANADTALQEDVAKKRFKRFLGN